MTYSDGKPPSIRLVLVSGLFFRQEVSVSRPGRWYVPVRWTAIMMLSSDSRPAIFFHFSHLEGEREASR